MLSMIYQLWSNIWSLRMLWSKEFILMRKRERQLSIFWRIMLLLVKILSLWWFLRQKRRRICRRDSRFLTPDLGVDFRIEIILFLFYLYFGLLFLSCCSFVFVGENFGLYPSSLFVGFYFWLVSIFIYISTFCLKKEE
jgi:hypothetical protein